MFLIYPATPATVTNGVYTTSSVTALSDVTSAGSGAILTTTERTTIATSDASVNILESSVTIIDASLNTHETAITANTAKTGITSAQATAITANTAKTGLTSVSQAYAITANTAKISYTSCTATALLANDSENRDQQVTMQPRLLNTAAV